MSSDDVAMILQRLAVIEAMLKEADAPKRIRSLEMWRSGITACLALVFVEMQFGLAILLKSLP